VPQKLPYQGKGGTHLKRDEEPTKFARKARVTILEKKKVSRLIGKKENKAKKSERST